MDHTRHRGIFSVEDFSISLVGAGGIGSAAALALVKMGVGYLTVYDGDEVSEVNLPTQLHLMSSVGETKVNALAETIAIFSDDTQYFPVHGLVDGTFILQDFVVIAAVDSIQARKHIWASAKNSCRWFIDPRMSAEVLHVYTVDMSQDTTWYETMLARQDDASIPDAPCTSKATIFCGMAAGAAIGKTVRQIATGIIPPHGLIWDMINDKMLKV
jgi:molybdopterin/thiamine biosynthesis adenylyltransferase